MAHFDVKSARGESSKDFLSFVPLSSFFFLSLFFYPAFFMYGYGYICVPGTRVRVPPTSFYGVGCTGRGRQREILRLRLRLKKRLLLPVQYGTRVLCCTLFCTVYFCVCVYVIYVRPRY